MAPLTQLSRRQWLAFGAAAGLTLASRRTRAAASVKVGLIDLDLRPGALDDLKTVAVRQMSLWASGFQRAAKQSRDHHNDHAEVMARALAGAFASLAPDTRLELYVATPVIERPDGRQVMDLDQLAFAFEWFAANGVRIVAATFVGRDTPQLAEAMSHARRHGLIVLASAGNGPTQNPVPAFPAAYDGVIAVSTTALAADRNAEERVLREVGMTRATYVDYAVRAPHLSSAALRKDPEAAALLGSSRAVSVAAGLLAAASAAVPVNDLEGALTALDQLCHPVESDAAASGLAARGIIDMEWLRQRKPLLESSREKVPV
ncbi:MAG: S8 family serine peptidase [Rhodospirillaceae bacterium]|nr:S8 family serine peptidase [Rhodospirillaceae bacterium]